MMIYAYDDQGMGEVPTTYIFAAMLPAFIITCLMIFDHSVAAQLAEQEVFNLQAPPAHHYDMFLLGFMVYMQRHSPSYIVETRDCSRSSMI
jgi:hypothetical protein